MDALTIAVAPKYKDERAMVGELLWPAYSPLEDSASFLMGVIHWAKHSLGSVTVADMTLPGAPLVYVNDHFTELCGFSKEEILGSNCRFLQGPETEPEMVASMQVCIRTGRDCHVRLTNCRKDGSTFCNLLSLRPIHDSVGVLRFMIGLQSSVTFEQCSSNAAAPRKTEQDEDNACNALDLPSLRKLEWHQRVYELLLW